MYYTKQKCKRWHRYNENYAAWSKRTYRGPRPTKVKTKNCTGIYAIRLSPPSGCECYECFPNDCTLQIVCSECGFVAQKTDKILRFIAKHFEELGGPPRLTTPPRT